MELQKLQEIKQRFGIIGNSEGLNRAIERAYQVAPTDYSILVTGESGVGKEHFPQIVHSYSLRKHARYIAINCGAIPNGTIDSELFGHVKGAFTGALNDHKGYFEEADGGTIFLDEVGELPLETQVRLLRVLETGEFIRVGSSQPQKTNVRVVAATNLNMQEAIQTGRFREDLYYRLSTISIQVPALRDRKEDIPVLFRKFAADCTERYRMPPLRLTDDARQLLMNYYFRGNIRQLKNIAEQICVLEQHREINAQILQQYLPDNEIGRTPMLSRSGQASDYSTEREILYKVLFDMKHEIDELKRIVAAMTNADSTVPHNAAQTLVPTSESAAILRTTQPSFDDTQYQQAEEVRAEEDIPNPMQHFEKETIRKALERNNGNRKAACREIGISERTLYRKIKEYGL
ncbi:MAG: sigma 54-interacting transcriptional regulator [Paludibacter sp.]|nr:sigma 54-interacting transcriptional regulator [Bacteroidales bacterium]MCM1068338.1 sigma 54-interacting transcriptional regulator [Prevotella sp.]MCM1354034.1 sigma 54-interacting transcriptional regulator [Bacteroides sp.]MCM1442124.1 sigma 54-interacting transcriptional regulator [Muribaculum sp.]MCM1481983.1 sigma 54-interacting transcriptional regulator [Paludibacter sp.]